MRKLLVFGAILACLGIVACSKPESKLIGKWVGKTGTFEFAENKTGMMTLPQVPSQKFNATFKWSMQGDDVVALVFAHPINKTTYGKLSSSDSLVIEDDTFKKQ